MKYCYRILYTYEMNYNFGCGSVWVSDLVSDIKAGTWTEGV
jgi:hypothetical protein